LPLPRFGGLVPKIDLEKKTLLLVAGPSGAGKTVFINQYRSRTLAPELTRLLPANAERWPQIGANDCMKRGVGIDRVLPREWPAPGGIAHYDTAYVHRFGLGYEHDPVSELFLNAGQVIVVSIRPPAETLKAQFEARTARQRAAKKTSHVLWKDHVRRPIERAIGRIKGIDPRDTGELYRDAGWLNRCYDEWTTFAGHLIRGKPGSRLIALEPCLDDRGNQSFRLISAS